MIAVLIALAAIAVASIVAARRAGPRPTLLEIFTEAMSPKMPGGLRDIRAEIQPSHAMPMFSKRGNYGQQTQKSTPH